MQTSSSSRRRRSPVAALIGVGALASMFAFSRRRSRWFSYSGKTVLVTGGSRGLGLVVARELVDLGAHVVIAARNRAQLERAELELLRRSKGSRVLAVVCDVRDAESVQTLVATATKEVGPIDVLINVAGIIEVGPFDTMTKEDFEDSMATNCWGPLNTIRAVLPTMRERRWGRIINVASFGGKRSVPHMTPYAASKFALVGLSGALRSELAHEGILLTTVCPGLIRTGSPRNATFKGKHRAEYAWFSIGDSLPGVSLAAETVAKKLLEAGQRGDAEVLIPGYQAAFMVLQAAAPNLAAAALGVMGRLLPSAGGIGTGSAKGYESESIFSPSWITALGEHAARRNNEL